MASTVGLEVLSTHMVIFPLAAWTIFLVVLIMRHFLGARGRRWSYWNITAFLLALGVLLGISLQ